MSVVAGYYEGPKVDTFERVHPSELSPNQVRAYASAFLEAQGIPQDTIAKALRINRRTHYRRVRQAAKYAVEAGRRRREADLD